MVFGQWIRAGLEDSPKKKTIRVLDGVRAFARLIVIWFHIYRIPRDLSFSRFFGNYFVNQHPAETVLLPRSFLDGILVFTYGVSGKYLEDFGVGMLLSLCFVYVQYPTMAPKLRTTLQKLSPWIWGTGLLCLLTMILWTYNDSYPKSWPLFNHPWLFSAYSLLNELCISLAFALCICALLFGSAPLNR